MKNTTRFISVLFITFLLLSILVLCISCSGVQGYSILLWSLPDYNLSDGDIVPVYIKSNISQVYVIGIPSSDEKIEIPLWQITDPVSKRAVKKEVRMYEEYQHQYASVAIDGLPMRFEPVNTAKQVYRLRKSEVIKVLYKGTGTAPMTGGTPLKGDWLRVMASDGTAGWCFSYNLRLFDERDDGKSVQEQTVEKDAKIERILNQYWYPDYYTSIINSGIIDLSRMKVGYGFNPGFASGTIRFSYGNISVSYPYQGFSVEKEGVYRFTGTPLIATYRNDNLIVIQYTGGNGIPQSFNLVTISESIEQLVKTERDRRENLLNQLIARGPSFSSSNYGTLLFKENDQFSWTGYSLLSGDLIPTGSGTSGTVSISYLLDSSLSFSYDGVLSFKFSGTEKELNFLYQLESDGLRLEDASSAIFKNEILTQRNQNPVILYFAK